MSKRRADRRPWHEYTSMQLQLAKSIAVGDLPARQGPFSRAEALTQRYTFNALREALRLSTERAKDLDSYPARLYAILAELIVRVVPPDAPQCYVEYDLHPGTRYGHSLDPEAARSFEGTRRNFAKAQQFPSQTSEP